jgi:hypothetical protein
MLTFKVQQVIFTSLLNLFQVKRLSNGDVVPTWKIGDEISGNFSTVYLKDSNSLIYTEGNQVCCSTLSQ